MTPTPSPRTAAGRALLADYGIYPEMSGLHAAILAIEAQAAPAGGLEDPTITLQRRTLALEACEKRLIEAAAPPDAGECPCCGSFLDSGDGHNDGCPHLATAPVGELREALLSEDDLAGILMDLRFWDDNYSARSFAKALLAALAASPSAAPLDDDERIREALWRGHGHDFIYGDDMEMQCNWAVDLADFKREPLDRLLDHCDKARLFAAAYSEEGAG